MSDKKTAKNIESRKKRESNGKELTIYRRRSFNPGILYYAGHAALWLYVGGGILNGLMSIYKRGKRKALEYRVAKKFSRHTEYHSESEALWDGARSGLLVAIPNAIFWPLRVGMNLYFRWTAPPPPRHDPDSIIENSENEQEMQNFIE